MHVPTYQGRRVGANATRLLPPWLSQLIRVLVVLLVVAPVIGLLWLSGMPSQRIIDGRLGPGGLTLTNYGLAFREVHLAASLVHTLISAGIAAVMCVLCSSTFAYVASRFWRRRSSVVMNLLIGAQTLPGAVILLPLFIMFVFLQGVIRAPLIGTYPALILTFVAFGLPLSTWLMWSYMEGVPEVLEEAALVDGASRLRSFFYIVVPLMRGGMIVIGVLVFIGAWNDLQFASVLTNDSTQTVSVTLQSFLATESGAILPQYGPLMAASVIVSLPVVVLYLVFQRQLSRGLSLGAVKG